MPTKPRQSGATARPPKNDSGDEEYTPTAKRQFNAPTAGVKRPRAPAAKTRVTAAGKREVENGEEGKDPLGDQGQQTDSGEEESEEEQEKIEYRPAKQARRSSVLNNPILKQAMIQYQAEEQKKAQAKKRSKKPAKDKIDVIFEQGTERLNAAWEGKGGYMELKASIQERIAATIAKIDGFREDNEALDLAMKGHQASYDSFSAQLKSYMQDRQTILAAVNGAINAGERRSSIVNSKIHNFKLERDVMVQQATSHIQDSFDGNKLARPMRHSLVLH